ncbi:hypothetical protein [Leifsonia tongyongensis]|nr:hypothetical protein [Diaminobutyricibacter tongyongensis]
MRVEFIQSDETESSDSFLMIRDLRRKYAVHMWDEDASANEPESAKGWPKDSTEEMTRRLREVLGPALIAVITYTTADQVAMWEAGTVEPLPEQSDALQVAFGIVEELLEVDTANIVRAWFMGMNPQLDDATPAEGIANGRASEVAAAAGAFIQSG